MALVSESEPATIQKLTAPYKKMCVCKYQVITTIDDIYSDFGNIKLTWLSLA